MVAAEACTAYRAPRLPRGLVLPRGPGQHGQERRKTVHGRGLGSCEAGAVVQVIGALWLRLQEL